jgi:hypothetical protein
MVASLGLGLLVIGIATYLWLTLSAASPVPPDIHRQLDFKVLYPASSSAKAGSWNYSQDVRLLSFTVEEDGYTASITEQRTPLEYQDDPAAYNRFIGGLRPSATFKARLGEVSITRFVTEGKFEDVGETGILNAQGTLMQIHPSRELNDNEWRQLTSSLVVAR